MLNPDTKEAYELFHNGILALSRAEQQGFRVDVDYVLSQKKHLTRRIGRLERKFKDSNFYKHWEHVMKKADINSNQKLGHYIYNVKKIKPAKLTTTGKGSTDEEALKQLNIPELNDLLDIRKLKKVRDTYLDAFHREQVDGYIHPFFNLHLVKTYRSSSDSPNFQNIPKRDEEAMSLCRRALYPRPGHQLMEIDYSGLEVRIAACYHKDPTMLKYLNDPCSDMHTDMAKQIFMLDKIDKSIAGHDTLRQAAKNGFVFPEFYGDYYKNCAENMACNWGKLPHGTWKKDQGIEIDYIDKMFKPYYLSNHLISKGIKSYDAFVEHVRVIEQDFWGKRFKVYAKWKDRWWEEYKQKGYIHTYTGFTCSGIMSKNDCINYPVQGAAFHCLLWSLIKIDQVIQKEHWDTQIIGQIHDSIILDVNPNELKKVWQTIHYITCEDLPGTWKWICVPLEVDAEICEVDTSWNTKTKYKE